MSKLKENYKSLQEGLAALSESLNRFQKCKKINDEKLCDITVDNVIKLFERSIDLTWEYLKLFLEKTKDVELQCNGAKSTIKCALSSEILTKDEAKKAIEMLDSRILLSLKETEKEEAEERIKKLLPEYLLLMKTIVEKTKP